jgi:hypothetical protein
MRPTGTSLNAALLGGFPNRVETRLRDGTGWLGTKDSNSQMSVSRLGIVMVCTCGEIDCFVVEFSLEWRRVNERYVPKVRALHPYPHRRFAV